VSELIEKRKLITCIRKFIEERVKTQEYVEILESIRDYVEIEILESER